MNKKEIAEIKKQFTPDRCSITRICGCYVDGEKNKKTELKEAFLSLSAKANSPTTPSPKPSTTES